MFVYVEVKCEFIVAISKLEPDQLEQPSCLTAWVDIG